ncbi:MAG: hypothetical protein J6T32_04480 [Paludibacteraceae bacterium]|nr:hypothetical protein [Paludibacteraceae bacterium]
MNHFLYRIDRLLSQGQGRQILYMALVVSVLVGLFWIISATFGLQFTIGQVIQLILAPGEFVNHGENHLAYQVIVNLIGLVLVSSLLIPLERQKKSYFITNPADASLSTTLHAPCGRNDIILL